MAGLWQRFWAEKMRSDGVELGCASLQPAERGRERELFSLKLLLMLHVDLLVVLVTFFSSFEVLPRSTFLSDGRGEVHCVALRDMPYRDRQDDLSKHHLLFLCHKCLIFDKSCTETIEQQRGGFICTPPGPRTISGFWH